VSGPARPRFVVASANPDKVAEIAAVLEPLGIVLDPRPASVPDVVEDAATLEGNARLKAVAIARATGAAAVADDTGLEVDALGGAPGVRSARFAGEHATYAENVAHLLAELDRVGADAPARRRARFRTVALVRWPDGREVSVSGVVEGRIAGAAQGDGGFGYDPVFVPDEGGGRTFAQMTHDEKHAISHRGRAFRHLAEALDEAGRTGPAATSQPT
jgi:XTP/dITP diphosphohydrolase